MTLVPPDWVITGQGNDGSVDEGVGAGGTRCLGALVVVPLGGEPQTGYRYRLPSGAVANDNNSDVLTYRLAIQK